MLSAEDTLGEIDPFILVGGILSASSPKWSWHDDLCWVITQISRFSRLRVFPLVSLGETVSVQDKIKGWGEWGVT